MLGFPDGSDSKKPACNAGDLVGSLGRREQRLVHVVFLPLCLWVSRLGPSSVETTPEKISSRSTFPSVWEPGGKQYHLESPCPISVIQDRLKAPVPCLRET